MKTWLNFSQINVLKNHIFSHLSLNSLRENEEYKSLKNELCKQFNFKNLNTFSFCQDGFLGLFLKLGHDGKIAVCEGECEAVYQGAKAYEDLGFKIVWIHLQKNGKINLHDIKNNQFAYLFLSSYVMDTFVKSDLQQVKKLSKAKIISNASANFSSLSDAIYFDTYKLSGFNSSGVLLYNGLFKEQSVGFIDTIGVHLVNEGLKYFKPNSQIKDKFLDKLKQTFKEDMFFFVNPHDTLDFILHVGFKKIKARELILGLALQDIFITNGEGCALGLARPSRVIELMDCGLDNKNAICFSFSEDFNEDNIDFVTQSLYKKYRQIRALNE